MSGERISFRLDSEELKRVDAFCKANRISRSELLRSAMDQKMDTESNTKMLFRMLSSTNKRLTRLENRTAIFSEAFMLALETMLVFTPPAITEQQEKIGAARLEGFFQDLKEELKKGGMLGQKLDEFIEPKEPQE